MKDEQLAQEQITTKNAEIAALREEVADLKDEASLADKTIEMHVATGLRQVSEITRLKAEAERVKEKTVKNLNWILAGQDEGDMRSRLRIVIAERTVKLMSETATPDTAGEQEPEYEPWSLERHPEGVVWVKRKDTPWECLITEWMEKGATSGGGYINYDCLLNQYTRLDGSPCGNRKESSEQP